MSERPNFVFSIPDQLHANVAGRGTGFTQVATHSIYLPSGPSLPAAGDVNNICQSGGAMGLGI